MWPYRPQRLSELLDASAVEYLLGFGAPLELRSSVALIEKGPDDLPVRFDPGPRYANRHSSPFCSFLRHGKSGGKTAFAGADEGCARCESKLALRALTTNPDAPDYEERGHPPAQSRCHMGLTDFAAPIVVQGKVVAVVVAGQCVEEEGQRNRIAKTVGKLGKLTRGEVRSLEDAGARVEAPIRLSDDRAREMLLQEIPNIPLIQPTFRDDLLDLAKSISDLASRQFESSRRRWEDSLLDSLFPDVPALPSKALGSLHWLRSAVSELHRTLQVEYVAAFARFPNQLDESLSFLPLAAQSGLTAGEDGERADGALPDGVLPDGTLPDDASMALLEIHPERLASGRDAGAIDRLASATSGLISALRTTERSPSEWKDRMTKCLFVAPLGRKPELEMVYIFGPAAGDATPQPDDFPLLLRAAERISERYRFLVLEFARRMATVKLKKLEEATRPKPKPKPGPIRPQRFDFRRLFGQCLEAEQEIATSRKVSFDSLGFPERFMLAADRNKLKAILASVLRYAVENARPEETDNTGSSVLVTCRRDRRNKERVQLVVDMLGTFLSTDERRSLLRTGPSFKAEAAGKTSPYVSFRDAQRHLSWHGGRLSIECTRTHQEDGGNGENGIWLGRTVFTLLFKEAEVDKKG